MRRQGPPAQLGLLQLWTYNQQFSAFMDPAISPPTPHLLSPWGPSSPFYAFSIIFTSLYFNRLFLVFIHSSDYFLHFSLWGNIVLPCQVSFLYFPVSVPPFPFSPFNTIWLSTMLFLWKSNLFLFPFLHLFDFIFNLFHYQEMLLAFSFIFYSCLLLFLPSVAFSLFSEQPGLVMLTQPHPSGPPTCLLDTSALPWNAGKGTVRDWIVSPENAHLEAWTHSITKYDRVPRRAPWELISKRRSFSDARSL